MTLLPFEPAPASQPATGFAEFYIGYPLKRGRRDAERAWRSACKRKTPDEINAGRDRYIANKPSWQNWMYPATFLRGDHCDDEYDTIDALKAGVVNGAFHGESLESIASNVKRAGTTWARYRYPRDVLEQCVNADPPLLTREEAEAAL